MSSARRHRAAVHRGRRYDVIIVGGGPSGAVMGWALAARGLRVAIVDRARFPREKVCGDFVEPRGLRLFRTMGCLAALEATHPLPITHASLFLGGRLAWGGRIPFYDGGADLPPHGYIIPREDLDHRLLNAAVDAGAELHEACHVEFVERRRGAMWVRTREGRGDGMLRAPLVVGADGAHSTVARCAGLYSYDPRHVAISQRAYADGVTLGRGEAAFFFDLDLFPGYGWLFPIAGGRANVGVGILAETVDRCGISVRQLLQDFLDTLRRTHPGCGGLRLASKPIGGIVRTYGAAGPNHFDGGILVGDAGCFVDPMTGEGITPAAESALLGAAVVAGALERGRADREFLRRYERAFRAYFDPAMQYLDFCACLMRNRRLGEFWIRAVTRGCELASADADFARVSGATFGGMDVRPLAIAAQLWTKAAAQCLTQSGRIATELISGRSARLRAAIADFGHLQAGWWTSWVDDPVWHARWVTDVGRKWLGLMRASALRDPRKAGPVELQPAERRDQRERVRVLRTSRSNPSGRGATRTASASASAARRSR